MDQNLVKVLSQFKINGTVVSVEPYGEGHINTTYLAIFDDNGQQKRYILQKINSNTFHPVEKLMNNILLVTTHLRKKIAQNGGNPDRECLTIIPTVDNKTFFEENENAFYRVYIFIENTVALQTVSNPQDFYNSAVAFSVFNNYLADFDASALYEIIPNFHNTLSRFNDFKKAVNDDKMNRKKDCLPEIDFIMKRESYYGKIVNLINDGKMPLRVTHNDTKLNNVLLDEKTKLPVSVIDLDTVMPGSVCYDFGDSIRFGCNPCAEDEHDLTKVNFRFDLYKTYLDGFLSSLKSITKIEKENLAFGAILMTIECGMRFLADYLNGDTYFKIHYEDQNLRRTRTQLKLVSDMEQQLDKMNTLI